MTKVYLWFLFLSEKIRKSSFFKVNIIINMHFSVKCHFFIRMWEKTRDFASIFLQCVEKDNNLGPLNFKPISKIGMMLHSRWIPISKKSVSLHLLYVLPFRLWLLPTSYTMGLIISYHFRSTLVADSCTCEL